MEFVKIVFKLKKEGNIKLKIDRKINLFNGVENKLEKIYKLFRSDE